MVVLGEKRVVVGEGPRVRLLVPFWLNAELNLPTVHDCLLSRLFCFLRLLLCFRTAVSLLVVSNVGDELLEGAVRPHGPLAPLNVSQRRSVKQVEDVFFEARCATIIGSSNELPGVAVPLTPDVVELRGSPVPSGILTVLRRILEHFGLIRDRVKSIKDLSRERKVM